MTEDELAEYAGRIASAALATTGDALVAGRVLFQALAVMLVARLGPKAAALAIREMGDDIADSLAGLTDPGETRQ